MDRLEQRRHADLEREPDTVQYKVLFFVDQQSGLNLYETLNLSSPPLLPDQGEYISFDFLVDEDENEVFRTDESGDETGYVPSEKIGTDKKYTELTSPDFKIKKISTTYNKGLSESRKRKTIIVKTVILEGHEEFY